MTLEMALNEGAVWSDVPLDNFAAVLHPGARDDDQSLVTIDVPLPDNVVGLWNQIAFTDFRQRAPEARSESELYKLYTNIFNAILRAANQSPPNTCDLPRLVYMPTDHASVASDFNNRRLPDAMLIDANVARNYDNWRVKKGKIRLLPSISKGIRVRKFAPPEDTDFPSADELLDDLENDDSYGVTSKVSELLPWSQVVVAIEIKLKPSGQTSPMSTTPSVGPTVVNPFDSKRITITRSHNASVPSPGDHAVFGSKRSRDDDGPTKHEDAFFKRLRNSSGGASQTSTTSQASTTMTRQQHEHQLLRYLIEMKTALGNRTRVFGCLISGTHFEIWMLDPSGLSKSEMVDITDESNMRKVIRVFYHLARSTSDILGFDNRFSSALPSEGHSVPSRRLQRKPLPTKVDGLWYRLDNTVVRLKEKLHTQWSASGRSTAVFLVEEGGQERVLKISYPFATRPREFILLRDASKTLIQNMGHCNGIPTVFDGYSCDTTILEGRAQRLLAEGSSRLVNAASQDRRMEAILMERLFPLRWLPTPLYTRALVHIIKTLYALDKAKIYHRDISSNNAMVRVDQSARTIDGVIADWDLAVDQNKGSRQHSHRQHWTGTLPFMALNQLLNPRLRHMLRFDLESVVWLCIWDISLYPLGETEGRNEQAVQPLTGWVSSDLPNGKFTAHLRFTDNHNATIKQFNDLTKYLKVIRPNLEKLARPICLSAISSEPDPSASSWPTLSGLFEKESFVGAFETMAEALEEYEAQQKLMPSFWLGYQVNVW